MFCHRKERSFSFQATQLDQHFHEHEHRRHHENPDVGDLLGDMGEFNIQTHNLNGDHHHQTSDLLGLGPEGAHSGGAMVDGDKVGTNEKPKESFNLLD